MSNIKDEIRQRELRLKQIHDNNYARIRTGSRETNLKEQKRLAQEVEGLKIQARKQANTQGPVRQERYFGQQNEGVNNVKGPAKRQPGIVEGLIANNNVRLGPVQPKPAPHLADLHLFNLDFHANRKPTLGPEKPTKANPSQGVVNSWVKNNNDRFKSQAKPLDESLFSDQRELNEMWIKAWKNVQEQTIKEATMRKNLNVVKPSADGKGYTTTLMVAGQPRVIRFDQVPNELDKRKAQEKLLAQDHPELWKKYQAGKQSKGNVDQSNRTAALNGILKEGHGKKTAESDSTDPGLWNNIVNATWYQLQSTADDRSRILEPIDTARRDLAEKIHPFAVNAGNSARKYTGDIGGDLVTGALDTLNGNGFKYITNPGSMAKTMGEAIDEGGFDGYKKFAWAPIEMVLAADEFTGLPTLVKGGAKALGKGVAKVSPSTYYKVAPNLFPNLLKKEAADVVADQALKRLRSKTIEVPRSNISVTASELKGSGLPKRKFIRRKQGEMEGALELKHHNKIRAAKDTINAHKAHELYLEAEELTKFWLHQQAKAYEQKLHREEAARGNGH
jgi:hypothetical protein